MNVLKYVLRVVDKVIIQWVYRQYEHFFSFLGKEKCVLDSVEEAMFKVVEWP
jgi:hypothetical protein